MEPLGLIAGEGVFPTLVARGARAAGRRVVCCAFSGSASADLANDNDAFHWVGIARPGSWIRILRRAGVSQAIMVGRVRKDRMYVKHPIFMMPDLTAVRLWFTVLR